MDDLPEIPQPVVLFRDAALYKRYKLDPDRITAVEGFRQPLDLYCVECGRDSVFRRTHPPSYAGQGSAPRRTEDEITERILTKRTFTVNFACTRDASHSATFIFRVGDNAICKIGQFPSLADLRHREKKKYRKILGDQYGEFARAIGLYAHGIGIGSFVYLRRIFEGLVEDAARQKKQQNACWDIEDWRTSRMEEKIEALADLLPRFLVENSSIYSILSKGIHQLSEEECKEYFNVLRSGIELILDDRLAQQEKRRKERLTRSAIARIKGEIN